MSLWPAGFLVYFGRCFEITGEFPSTRETVAVMKGESRRETHYGQVF